MDTIFMNSEKSKTSDPYRLLLKLSDKINLKRLDKYVVLSNLCIQYTKKPYKKKKFKISAPIWNLNYLMDHILYQIFKIILNLFFKKRKMVTDNPSVRININKIDYRTTSKIKTGYYLELIRPETMKLLGSIKSKITKDENSRNVPRLEITEVVLKHRNIVNNDYQQDSRVLYTFVFNKSFGQLLDISPKICIFLKAFNSEFSYMEVWLTDQNYKPLEIEDKANVNLVIN